ncbi:hemolysin family protein [Caviibacter abscessus]|uniref:hemolysin family protein n=1 Tax=Caviibacter abscessus TaxID=1766719 RepID=UPI0008379C89|nr:CBS domain-containing protein [Caviibacter abscessus]
MNGELVLLFIATLLLIVFKIIEEQLDKKYKEIVILYRYIFISSILFALKDFHINAIISTILLLLICEYIPRIIKNKYSELVYEYVKWLIILLSYIIFPVYYILKLIFREQVEQFSEEEIYEEPEEDQFSQTTVKEIMTPRTSLFALNMEDTIGAHLSEIAEQGFSRIPVYTESIDNIEGILYIKDILTAKHSTKIKDLARKAVYVPEAKPIEKMLEEFKLNQSHIAVIIDEYGGTSGIVTIEDILEEIVGEIRDEYDIEVDNIIKLTDNIFEVMGETSVEEINEEIGIEIPLSEEYETISGFVQYKLGKVAQENDQLNEPLYIIRVIEVENKKIIKLKIILLDMGGSKQ